MCFIILTGCYVDEPEPTEEPTEEPTPNLTPVLFSTETKIKALDGATNDYFGYSVSISGNYAIIGASGDEDQGNDSGSAYIFIRNGTTWTEQQKLTASDWGSNDLFGISVNISGDYAAVGANHSNDNGNNSGSAYIFE